MKILLLGAFGKGALEHFYVNGLKAQTNEIATYDIASPYYTSISRSVIHKGVNKVMPGLFFMPINKELERFVSGKFFDVILVFKGLTLFPETISLLKQHARILCCYNPDHPFKFFSEGSGNKNILQCIPLYDIYLTYSVRIAADLRKLYKVNAHTIPFGYDNTNVVNTVAPKDDIKDKWLFIGAYDKERASFLHRLAVKNLRIYGDSKWRSRTLSSTMLKAAYGNRSIYDEEYKAYVSMSGGVINLLRQQNIEESSHNMRTFEVPGYGGLLIANRTEEQLSFFEEDREAIYFDTIEELNDKLHYLEANRGQIAKIKLAATERSLKSNYSYFHRSLELYGVFTFYLK
jgi:spore maturation protein CgeB